MVIKGSGKAVKNGINILPGIATFRIDVKKQALPGIGICVDSVLVINVTQQPDMAIAKEAGRDAGNKVMLIDHPERSPFVTGLV